MRFVIFCLFLLSCSQSALACGSLGFLNHHDEAFADVIFEGEIKAIRPTLYWNKHSEREQVREIDLIFEVSSVLRGDLPEGRLVVGWESSFGGYPSTFAEFTKRYGTELRVALITPRQIEKFCREGLTQYTRGTGEKFEKMRWSCDVNYGGTYNTDRVKAMPFVLTQPCSRPYMFPAKPELSIEEFGAIAKPYGRVLLGWEEISFRVVQKNLDYLDSPLKADSAKLSYLIEESKRLAEKKGHHAFRPDSTEKGKAHFVRMVSHKFIKLSDLFEKDPELRERYRASGGK